ncbi:phospholipid-binding protein MlaC [Oceanidesulfovibrio marinus]|uniref:ABC transporter substrate-binding protein n=1 Tax=Oceanidesulfovibrio marinus TaxID=370038 RepID=A0A6P1ZHR9_9BACT|nr:ABC transporter substrate-binding protein [Oceanidesulfovibrio marinus]TVM34564.1 ABC transporter substrate-binding protein [Oceanidesulfovibrio marinus]
MRMLCTAVVLFLCLCLTPCAFAAQTDDAESALRNSIDQILSILGDSSYKGGANRQERDSKLRTHINEIFDFKALTARALGVHWKQFSPQQQDEASQAMSELLEATYRDSLDKYDNQRVEYTDATQLRDNQVEIRTLVVSNAQKLPINYRMELTNGAWRIYDVVIEGVSLVQNYRSQFQDFMLNKTPEELITLLKDKAAKQRSNS